MSSSYELRIEELVNGTYQFTLPGDPLHDQVIDDLLGLYEVVSCKSTDGRVLYVKFNREAVDISTCIAAFVNRLAKSLYLPAKSFALVGDTLTTGHATVIRHMLPEYGYVGFPPLVDLLDVGTGPGNEILVVNGTSEFQVVRIVCGLHLGQVGYNVLTVVELFHSSYTTCSLGVEHEHVPDYFGLDTEYGIPNVFAIRDRTEDRRQLVQWMLHNAPYDEVATKILRRYPEDFVELSVVRELGASTAQIVPTVTPL